MSTDESHDTDRPHQVGDEETDPISDMKDSPESGSQAASGGDANVSPAIIEDPILPSFESFLEEPAPEVSESPVVPPPELSAPTAVEEVVSPPEVGDEETIPPIEVSPSPEPEIDSDDDAVVLATKTFPDLGESVKPDFGESEEPAARKTPGRRRRRRPATADGRRGRGSRSRSRHSSRSRSSAPTTPRRRNRFRLRRPKKAFSPVSLTKSAYLAEYRRELPMRRSWDTPSSSFASRASRFDFQRTNLSTPSPDRYNISGSPLLTKPSSGKSFNTTSKRFHDPGLKERSSRPSPMAYHRDRGATRGPSHSFPSGARFKANSKPSPSPLHYDVMASYKRNLGMGKSHLSSSFRSTAKRFGVDDRLEKETVHSVQYGDPAGFRGPKHTSSRTTFGTSSRFAAPKKETPAPGAHHSRSFTEFNRYATGGRSILQGSRFREFRDDRPGPGEYQKLELPEHLHRVYK